MQLIIYHGLGKKKKKNPSTTQSFRQGMHLMIPLLLLLWKAELCLAGLSDITHVKQRAAKNKKECLCSRILRERCQRKLKRSDLNVRLLRMVRPRWGHLRVTTIGWYFWNWMIFLLSLCCVFVLNRDSIRRHRSLSSARGQTHCHCAPPLNSTRL